MAQQAIQTMFSFRFCNTSMLGYSSPQTNLMEKALRSLTDAWVLTRWRCLVAFDCMSLAFCLRLRHFSFRVEEVWRPYRPQLYLWRQSRGTCRMQCQMPFRDAISNLCPVSDFMQQWGSIGVNLGNTQSGFFLAKFCFRINFLLESKHSWWLPTPKFRKTKKETSLFTFFPFFLQCAIVLSSFFLFFFMNW